MIVLDNNSISKLQYETYIALGSFDGLHLGHISLIKKAKDLALQNNAKSMIYTFTNHPLSIIDKERVPKLIMDNETKVDILEKLGIDIACFVNFNKNLMEMSPEEFIVHIKHLYNIKGIVVGFNYKFGHKNYGDVTILRQLSEKYNFEVYVLQALSFKDEIISSSRIRKLIIDGGIEVANKMLYQPYMITGKVISGKKLGRTLGFPTANLIIEDKFIYPKIGVYYTNLLIDGKIYKGITNIGFNPTVQGDTLSLETYILDFNENVYERFIKIFFVSRIREEIKFNSIDGLVKQLELDKMYAVTKEIELTN